MFHLQRFLTSSLILFLKKRVKRYLSSDLENPCRLVLDDKHCKCELNYTTAEKIWQKGGTKEKII